MTLNVENLSGGYQRKEILHQVSFSAPSGSVTALVGLNGAGKSTIIQHLIGLLKSTQGTIQIDELDLQAQRLAFLQQVAYVPEMPELYPELTVREHLQLTLAAYQLDIAQKQVEIDELARKFRLTKELDWYPSEFSKGMRQKVMLMAAFLTDAKLLIVDEPFLGLDPLATNELVELMKDKAKQGVTVLISTHALATVEQFVNHYVWVDQGRILATGDVAAIKKQFPQAKTLADIYVELANR